MSFFSGKRVLITGGSSGIGLAAAKKLHAEKAELLLVARDPQKLKEAMEEIDSGLAPISTYSLDISDAAAVEATIAEFGAIDILINNAGITRPGNFLELPEECFQQMLDVNYLAAVRLTRLLVPSMIERKEGRIAFVSSFLGLMGIWGYSAYAASKFAVRGFAECLRCELNPHNIGVSVCYPPDTDTPQHDWEQPYLPAETIAQAGTAGLLSPEFVADCLLLGIRKGKFQIVPGLQASLIEIANRLAPGVVRTLLDHDARKVRAERI